MVYGQKDGQIKMNWNLYEQMREDQPVKDCVPLILNSIYHLSPDLRLMRIINFDQLSEIEKQRLQSRDGVQALALEEVSNWEDMRLGEVAIPLDYTSQKVIVFQSVKRFRDRFTWYWY